MSENNDARGRGNAVSSGLIANILLVGISNPRLEKLLLEHGYRCLCAPDIDSIGTQETPYALMIVHQDLVVDTFIERLFFLNNRVPIAILVANPNVIADSTLSILQVGAIELLYEHEIASGLIRNRIDRIYLDAQLDRNLEMLQKEHYERERLSKELSLHAQILQHERELKSNIIDSITAGLAMLDLNGITILINEQAQRLLNLVPGPYTGILYTTVFPPEVQKLIDEARGNIHLEKPPPPGQKIRIGDTYLEMYCYNLLDNSKKPSGILLLLHDVTEQENLTMQLYRAEKLSTVGTMLSGIAHELRNPLAIISARVKRAMAKPAADHTWMAKSFESIERQAERCITIVNDLLDFTRTTSLGSGHYSVAEILDEALEYCRYQKSFLDIKIEKDYRGDPTVYCERSRLMQASLNIIMNAVDAMGEKGTLAIMARAGDRNTTLIEIHDTGCGIDPKIATKIFDPFFTTKEPGKGTGLGLAIVYKIMQESGGAIWFNSEPGNTTWYLSLPRAKDMLK
jgi:C4-dicarboxylate-specific signal transduction histidine kinase